MGKLGQKHKEKFTRNPISLADRKKVLNLIDQGKSIHHIETEIKLDRKTIRRIRDERQTTMGAIADGLSLKKKRITRGNNDRQLLGYINKLKERKIPVTGDLIKVSCLKYINF